jgi:hypothetical protein
MKQPAVPCVFAVYARLDAVVGGIHALREAGEKEFQVFSPVPHHDILHAIGGKPSPVRVYTLAGGLLGLVIGWGITIGPLGNFGLHVGGKPLLSIPPFGVVAYIATILFGALATLLGMIINTRLPQVNLAAGYDGRVSSDHFGIRVRCAPERMEAMVRLLKRTGAVDVRRAGV